MMSLREHNPNRTHIDVIRTMPPQQKKARAIRGKCQQANCTDHLEHRKLWIYDPLNRLPQNEETKGRHDDAFEQSRTGFHC